jgi:phenylacetate-coenzyme A ligase PaaK-like adenylate-forming protein
MGKPTAADLTPKRGALDPIEIASRDELAALQLDRLKWSLKHAYENVPHYKSAFDKAGVHHNDLKALSDLARFPFTSKNDLRKNYPFGLFAVPRRLWLRAIHWRPWRALRRRAAGLHRNPGIGGHDRTAGAPDRRIQA